MTSLLAPIDPSASVRARILDVAQMLFADHGYTGASTRAIALAAGVNLQPFSVFHSFILLSSNLFL